MLSVNFVEIIGCLGADPETKDTQSGLIVRMRVATNRSWKGRDGERQSETEWHSVTAFGRTAEVARDWLHKGDQVRVTGRIRTRKYQAKDGTDRYATEIVAENLQLGAKKTDGGEREDSFESQPRPRKETHRPAQSSGFNEMAEDVPF